jgi:hypothetical protein
VGNLGRGGEGDHEARAGVMTSRACRYQLSP